MTAVQEIEALAPSRRRRHARVVTLRNELVGARRAARDGRVPRGRPHPHVRRGLARPAAPDPADGAGRAGEVLELPDGPVVQPDPRRRAAVRRPHLAAAAQRRGRHRDPRRRPALRLVGHRADRVPRGPRARHHRARRRELPVAVPRADHLRADRRPAHGRHLACATSTSSRSPPASGTTRTCSARCRPSARRRPADARAAGARGPRPARATRWSTRSRPGPAGTVPRRADFRVARPLASAFVDDVLTAWEPGAPVRISYEDLGVNVDLHADPVYAHLVVYAPRKRSVLRGRAGDQREQRVLAARRGRAGHRRLRPRPRRGALRGVHHDAADLSSPSPDRSGYALFPDRSSIGSTRV